MKKIINVLLGMCLLFIVFNSLKSGETSSGLSLRVAQCLEPVNPFQDFSYFHLFIRKLAHFSEYFAYGALLLTSLHFKTLPRKVIFTLALLPCFDETLQHFIEGRDGNIVDVLIDYSGMMTALFGYRLMMFLMTFKQKNTCSKAP